MNLLIFQCRPQLHQKYVDTFIYIYILWCYLTDLNMQNAALKVMFSHAEILLAVSYCNFKKRQHCSLPSLALEQAVLH